MGERGSDLDGRLGVEQDVEAAEARTRLLKAVPTDVWWTDGEGLLQADLPAWRSHTAQPAEAVLGMGWVDAVREDRRESVASAWRQAVAAAEPFEGEFPIVSPEGTERVVVLRAHPVVRGGENREWVGTAGGLDHREVRDLWFEIRTAETLRRVTAALVSELDLDRVVRLVTDAARELIGADIGAFLYHPDDVRGEAGFPLPYTADLLDPTFRGEGIIRLDDITADPRAGDRAGRNHGGVRSYLAVPVVSARGDVLGGLFFGHSQAGVFTVRHERLVAGIAAPAAIAIDNARLYQAAQAERSAAQRLAERLTHMQAVSARLAGAREVGEVAEVVVSGVARAFECARASLYTLENDGETLRLVHSFGYEGRFWDRWRYIDPRAALPSSDALRERRIVLLRDQQQWGDRYPDAVPADGRSVALAILPLALGDQAFGIVAFGWDHPRAFEQDEVQFLESLAGQCSQALERARLYEVERETAR
ncbi:MAG: GAF domain-containing protein, partial [Acidimicrobiales bacterium]